MSFSATYLGSSGWIIKFNNVSILIDPWIKGDLFFPPGRWLISGELSEEINIDKKKIDVILLTQGLADHAHPESLDLFSKHIPIIGSQSACRITQKLGFESNYTLKPGEIINKKGVRIEATAGAPVPKIENGYILNHDLGSLYIEPHGFLDQSIKNQKVDVVISPVINLSLPIAGNFIKGKDILDSLIVKFNPNIIFASTTGGNAKFKGLLNSLISVDGNIEEARLNIGSRVDLINPEPYFEYNL